MTNEEDEASLKQIDREINAELGMPEAYGYEPPPAANAVNASSGDGADISVLRAARKPFRINDFDSPRDKEMAVFTHAKKLSEYVFVITEKSPKKLRWSIVSRLQNASVGVIESLYRANFEREEAPRIAYQKSAAVNLSLLDFYAETARRKQAITVHQSAIIARQIAETRKLLNGWIRSTKRQSV